MKTASKPTIRSVKLMRAVDNDPDTSFLGEYTDIGDDWAIERDSGEYVIDLPESHSFQDKGREYRFFIPYAGGAEPGSDDYRKYGKQDFDRMESLQRCDWSFVGVWAEAQVIINGVIQKLRSGGLWGIESDSDDSYFDSLRAEQMGELAAILESVGVSDTEVEEHCADFATWTWNES